jgi:hypothetical protein
VKPIDELPRGDCTLFGLAWCHDGLDLEVAVLLPDARRVKITYTWVAELQCHLSYPNNHGGPPMTWDVTYTADGDRRAVLWDFSSAGKLQFTFQDATYTDEDG